MQQHLMRSSRYRHSGVQRSAYHSRDAGWIRTPAQLLEVRALLAADFGDAPDTESGTGAGNYRTTAADGGPSHTVIAGLHLGDNVDVDDGTQQNARANADDHFLTGGSDDEDGVVSSLFALLNTAGAEPVVNLRATNLTGRPAVLYGWIDYNADGSFDNVTERAQMDVPTGSNDVVFALTFPAVPDGAAQATFARFRISTDIAAANSIGAAADGEVEDHFVSTCSVARQTADSYAVDPFLDSQGNCEQKIYHNGVQVGTVIQTPAGSITQRGRPEIDNNDGFGTSKQENVFVAGFDAAFGTIEQAVATPDGVRITASGIVAGDGGTWTWMTLAAYDSIRREVTFQGETTATLVSPLSGDLNVGRFSSNYLHDFELNDGNRGNSGDMTTTTLAFGDGALVVESDRSPNPEQVNHFPGDRRDAMASVRINGNINRTDPNRAAIVKPTAQSTLQSQTDGVDLFAGWQWSPSESDFSKDNVGASFLILATEATGQPMPFFNTTVWSIPDFDAVHPTGVFAQHSSLSSGSKVQAVERSDIDNDGDQDLIVVKGKIGDPQANQIYINQGDGTFLLSDQGLGMGESLGVALGDLDGDGDSDAFVANHGSNRVYINQGGKQAGSAGTFLANSDLLGAAESFDVALGDLDRDGDLDAFVTNRDNEPDRIWFNSGDGTFVGSGQAIGNIRGVAISLGDIDEDGDIDALIANESNGPNRIWVNQSGRQGGADGVFVEGAQLGQSGSDVELQDIDNDGDLDALVVLPTSIAVWENDDGNFALQPAFGSGSFSGISVGDMDADNDLDAFVVGSAGIPLLYVNQGGQQHGTIGSFASSPHPLQHAEATSSAAVADFNLDGVMDVVFVDGSDVLRVMLGVQNQVDYGDAPDSVTGTSAGEYQTRAADNGPSHIIVDGLHLGAHVDGDRGRLQNGDANADDVDQAVPDDEDGVLNPLDLRATAGAAPTIALLATNITGTPATLFGWIDYNGDGVFDNSTERAQTVVPAATNGSRFTLTFPSAPEGLTGTTYARFRLSTDAAAQNSTDSAADGEVEDYVFTLQASSTGRVKQFQKIGDGLGGLPLNSLQLNDRFGTAVASLGDLDGDQIPDMAVGAYLDENVDPSEGAVHVLFMKADGTVKRQQKISDGIGGLPNDTLDGSDWFGTSVANVGDIDGDGVADVVVGARGDENDATPFSTGGAVYVLFLRPDGTVKDHQKITDGQGGLSEGTLESGNAFGSSVAGIGDLDGDGVSDIAVGAYRDDDGEGAVYVLMLHSDGTVKSQRKIADGQGGFAEDSLESLDLFGHSVTGISDLDGDGVPDMVVGAIVDEHLEASEGAVYVLLMNTDGSVKSQQKISDGLGGLARDTLGQNDYFGSSVVSMGDLNGDGVTDLAVGARNDENNSGSEGAVYILFLNSDGTVGSQQKISDDLSGLPLNTLDPSDLFGASVANLGDLDGDGVPELAVGALHDEENDSGEGAVYVLFLEQDAPDLTAVAFDAVPDHTSSGLTTISFSVENKGSKSASAFENHIVWSANAVLGDDDDIVVTGTTEVFTEMLPGALESRVLEVQLDRALLYANSVVQDPAGAAARPLSADISHLFLVIDSSNAIRESDEANNFGQGHQIDGDDITYFPWDTNGNGVVTPTEALDAIRAINTIAPLHDFDGNGIVTPLEALAVLQRIGYRRNDLIVEQNLTGSTLRRSIAAMIDETQGSVKSPVATTASGISQADELDERDLFAERSQNQRVQRHPKSDDLTPTAVDAYFQSATGWLELTSL